MKKPYVISACGTFLKKEMQSIYRQISNLNRYETEVFAEKLENADLFPFKNVRKLYKFPFPRPKGNFFLRFFFKYILKKWPPPSFFTFFKAGERKHPYNLHLYAKEFSADVIHVYFGHKAVKYHSMLKTWGGPWIVSFHGVDVSKFMDKPEYAQSMREMLNDAYLVLARSQTLLDEIKKIGCDAKKLRLNHTLIPMDKIQNRIVCPPTNTGSNEIKNGKWKIIQACRLIEKKGIFSVLEALKLLIKKFPNVEYLIAGEGKLKKDILKKIEELGLENNVKLLGWLKSDELFNHFSECHIFIHPSEKTSSNDQEGIPNALIEAMVSGLPIIATKHGGIPEAVTDGKSGFLVPEKSPVKLFEALNKIMLDNSLLEKMSKNAYEEAFNKFELKNQIEVLESYYDEAISIHKNQNK